ncbi:MAG: heavy metal-binding domain-containing protein [Imperialibacter sp.]|uniref:heavy metal-binding domain-containing protein n=1 Tax=Imperialibacter sp. TaxID=2038411 RepID=UPI0032EE829B
MRNIVLTSLFAAALALSACNSNPKTTEEAATHDDAHQHETAASDTTVVAASYICPMKCEGSASDKPGKCPVCKMDLVAVEETPAEK